MLKQILAAVVNNSSVYRRKSFLHFWLLWIKKEMTQPKQDKFIQIINKEGEILLKVGGK